jgi:excisionase family DNA binding protein
MLRVPELSERLDLSKATVYRMLQSGRLPGLRIAGSWRVPVAALERWIEDHLSTAEK